MASGSIRSCHGASHLGRALGPAVAADITGIVVHIVDGDTFDIETPNEIVRIRLCGVDSPERGHTGYNAAKEALRGQIEDWEVRCVRVGEGSVCDGRSKPKNRDRIVAQCFLDDADVATLMIKARAACDWPKFSGGHYQNVGTADVCIRTK